MKGYLFYPLEQYLQKKFNAVQYLSNAHNKGWWIYHGENAIPQISNESRWMVLPKNRWLSLVLFKHSETNTLLDENEILVYCNSHFDNNNNALLLVELGQAGTDADNRDWIELSRGFVVDISWPKLIRQ